MGCKQAVGLGDGQPAAGPAEQLVGDIVGVGDRLGVGEWRGVGVGVGRCVGVGEGRGDGLGGGGDLIVYVAFPPPTRPPVAVSIIVTTTV